MALQGERGRASFFLDNEGLRRWRRSIHGGNAAARASDRHRMAETRQRFRERQRVERGPKATLKV